MRILPVIVLLFSVLTMSGFADDAVTTGWYYLNDLRRQAGLVRLERSDPLQAAAQKHSHYMQKHHTAGHDETEGTEDFYGKKSLDRALKAGYRSRMVSENLSAGQSDIKSSIDGLLAAIYHRFGFLSLDVDEIGIGVEGKYYTYDMGNMLLDQLCQRESYTGSDTVIYDVCKDENKKIKYQDYHNAKNHYKADTNAPSVILWPPVNGSPVPPAFYEETPDPLPDYGVSGYPVSVEFNDARFSSAPDPEKITLYLENDEGNQLEGIPFSGKEFMTKGNDPQKHLTAYQFALFPEKRLEWGHAYYATLGYGDEEFQWCFTTQSLADRGVDRVYRFDDGDAAERTVVSGTKYALYFVPQHSNDAFHGYSISKRYYDTAPTESIEFLDWNTLLFSIDGKEGDTITLTVRHDDGAEQTITLKVSGGDTADIPARATCGDAAGEGSIDPSGISDIEKEPDPDTGTSSDGRSDTSGISRGNSPAASSAGGYPSVMMFLMMVLGMIGLVRRVERG